MPKHVGEDLRILPKETIRIIYWRSMAIFRSEKAFISQYRTLRYNVLTDRFPGDRQGVKFIEVSRKALCLLGLSMKRLYSPERTTDASRGVSEA